MLASFSCFTQTILLTRPPVLLEGRRITSNTPYDIVRGRSRPVECNGVWEEEELWREVKVNAWLDYFLEVGIKATCLPVILGVDISYGIIVVSRDDGIFSRIGHADWKPLPKDLVPSVEVTLVLDFQVPPFMSCKNGCRVACGAF
jgi:hypothetical protein